MVQLELEPTNRFFQGFCVKVADTPGIVYTSPFIVRFIIWSVAETPSKIILQSAFTVEPSPFANPTHQL
jgi:hypothetical protein